MRDRFLGYIARLVTGRPWGVLAAAAVVSLVMGIAASTLPFDMTFISLLDFEEPEVKGFMKASENFGEMANLILVVQPPDREAGRKFITEVKEALKNDPDVAGLDSGIPRDFLMKYGPWLMSDADAEAAWIILSTPEKPMPGELAENINRAVALLHEAGGHSDLLPALEGMAGWIEKAAREGVPEREDPVGNLADALSMAGEFATPDGSMMLLVVRTNAKGIETTLGAPMFRRFLGTVKEIQKNYPGLEAEFTGINAIGDQDQNGVLARFKILSPLSMILMMGIFWFFTRMAASPVMLGFSLGAAVLWTFGLVRFTTGYVSLMTLVFAVFLFGLGVDFAVHLVMRYTESRAGGEGADEALRSSLTRAGPGVLTGGLTTATAFFMLMLSGFKGGVQLGFTTGIGLLCCLAASLFVFPAMIALWHRKRPDAKVCEPESRVRWLDAWTAFIVRRPGPVLAVCVAAALAVPPLIPKFEIVYDLDRMIYRDIPALDIKKEMESRFDTGTDFGVAFVDTVEEARGKARLLEEKASVKNVESIATLVGGSSDKKDALVKSILTARKRAEENKPADVSGEAWETAAAVKIGALRNLMRISVSPAPPRVEDLPESLRARYVARDGRFPLIIYPEKNVYRRENIREFKKDIRDVCPDATGMMIITEMMTRAGMDRLPYVCALVLLGIALIIYWDFRRLRDVFFAMFPVGLACAWTLGLLYLFQPMMTLFIGLAFPLVVGIGVDDGVHLVHRLREEKGPDAVTEAVRRTGRPIFMTTLTTVAGFGILLLTNHNGLIGMGAAITIGVIMCFAASVTALPAMWKLWGGEKKKE